MNESNALVASVMEKLPEVRAVQLQMRDPAQWGAMTEDQRNEITERLVGGKVKQGVCVRSTRARTCAHVVHPGLQRGLSYGLIILHIFFVNGSRVLESTVRRLGLSTVNVNFELLVSCWGVLVPVCEGRRRLCEAVHLLYALVSHYSVVLSSRSNCHVSFFHPAFILFEGRRYTMLNYLNTL